MATAGVPATPPPGRAGPAAELARVPGAGPAWLRLLRSELRLVFRRLRNLALLAALAALPVLLGIALRLAAPRGGGGGDAGAAFISQLAGNGVFLAFIAITLMIALVLPLAVAVVSGDPLACEARPRKVGYLLTVPAGRTRLLAAKYVAIVAFGLAACCVVVASALATGAALFPIGPVTLLSGNTVPLGEGLLRVLFVTLYVATAMAALGAIGLAVSTFTEHPIGAIATVLVLAVVSGIADNIPQFPSVQPYLPSHWWLFFDSLLRTPIATSDLLHGLLSFGVYALIFCSIAWARFTSTDVTA